MQLIIHSFAYYEVIPLTDTRFATYLLWRSSAKRDHQLEANIIPLWQMFEQTESVYFLILAFSYLIIWLRIRRLQIRSFKELLPRNHVLRFTSSTSAVVTIKSDIYCDVMSSSLMVVHRRFAEIYCLPLQGWKSSQGSSQ